MVCNVGPFGLINSALLTWFHINKKEKSTNRVVKKNSSLMIFAACSKLIWPCFKVLLRPDNTKISFFLFVCSVVRQKKMKILFIDLFIYQRDILNNVSEFPFWDNPIN